MNAAAGAGGRDLAATNEGLLSHIVVTLQRLDITGASPADQSYIIACHHHWRFYAHRTAALRSSPSLRFSGSANDA